MMTRFRHDRGKQVLAKQGALRLEWITSSVSCLAHVFGMIVLEVVVRYFAFGLTNLGTIEQRDCDCCYAIRCDERLSLSYRACASMS